MVWMFEWLCRSGRARSRVWCVFLRFVNWDICLVFVFLFCYCCLECGIVFYLLKEYLKLWIVCEFDVFVWLRVLFLFFIASGWCFCFLIFVKYSVLVYLCFFVCYYCVLLIVLFYYWCCWCWFLLWLFFADFRSSVRRRGCERREVRRFLLVCDIFWWCFCLLIYYWIFL